MNPALAPRKTSRPQDENGFSLVELMVAMLISLILIGGAISAFLSNQQTYRTTQELDDAQEAFRFASQTILRVVRQGSDFSGSDGNTLRVRMSGYPGSGLRDCLGREIVAADVVSQFTLSGNNLICTVTGENGASEVLATNIADIRFQFSDDTTDYWTSPFSTWTASAPDESRSVAIALQTEGSGLSVQFIATLRNATVNR